ncbi:MAG: hypothetical protein AAF614_13570 [Chloroflexota bacterium]
MKTKLSLIICFAFLFIACRQNVDENSPELLAELVNNIPDNLPSVRNERNCELFELSIEDDDFVLTVWNNAGMGHDCPDDWLAQIDRNDYFVDGPRWRSLDLQLGVGEDNEIIAETASETAVSDNVVAEVPPGLGLDMFLAAKVTIAPVSRVERTADLTINGLDDMPDALRLRLMSGRASEDANGYRVMEANRQQNTMWVYRAGNPVYLLSDGECSYAMKYYTSSSNPSINNEAILAELDSHFQHLPTGYTFEVRTFPEDRYIIDLNGKQSVMADEFGNSYDLFSCQEQ